MSSDDLDISHNTSTGSSYSPAQRKQIFKRCLGETRCLQQNVGKGTISTLENIMVTTDTISNEETDLERASRCDEIVLDSGLMSVSSDVLKRCTETLTKNANPYNALEFADKILSHVTVQPDWNSEEPQWPILVDDVLKCINVTPQYSYLLGCLKPLERKPVERRKQNPRDQQAPTKRPENVQTVAKVEDGVEETVHKIRLLINQIYKKEQKPLHFFQLVVNPKSFGRTVENMLHVAFLVRDGLVTLSKDETGRLTICPSSKEAITQAKKKGNTANVQNVMAINPAQWERLVKAYRIKTAMINFGTSGNS